MFYYFCYIGIKPMFEKYKIDVRIIVSIESYNNDLLNLKHEL